uniref:Uncharacterized protein n=1 Tax=Lepeophtheirus salmonis TaxID=72036 RepID=A0A0K2UYV0_LEPSM
MKISFVKFLVLFSFSKKNKIYYIIL